VANDTGRINMLKITKELEIEFDAVDISGAIDDGTIDRDDCTEILSAIMEREPDLFFEQLEAIPPSQWSLIWPRLSKLMLEKSSITI
jgi:hypothetical protein